MLPPDHVFGHYLFYYFKTNLIEFFHSTANFTTALKTCNFITATHKEKNLLQTSFSLVGCGEIHHFWVNIFYKKRNKLHFSANHFAAFGCVSCTNQISALVYVSRTNQITALEDACTNESVIPIMKLGYRNILRWNQPNIGTNHE